MNKAYTPSMVKENKNAGGNKMTTRIYKKTGNAWKEIGKRLSNERKVALFHDLKYTLKVGKMVTRNEYGSTRTDYANSYGE